MEGFYIYAHQYSDPSYAFTNPESFVELYRSNPEYKMLTVLNGGGASACTISGLMEYTEYEFFIVPFYKSIEGNPSNLRIARTMEDGEYTAAFYIAIVYFLLRFRVNFINHQFTFCLPVGHFEKNAFEKKICVSRRSDR